MASSYWDEALAARYRAFQYSFAERPLAGRVVILAGGTGGLGAATTMLLASEGAKLVVGFRSNRARAEALRAAVAGQTGASISLVEGDLVLPEVRRAYLDAAADLGPLEGGAIFPGDPARVSWESLDAAALRSSWDANFGGPICVEHLVGSAIGFGIGDHKRLSVAELRQAGIAELTERISPADAFHVDGVVA